MTLYTQSTSLPNVQWPEPMETVWQVLPQRSGGAGFEDSALEPGR